MSRAAIALAALAACEPTPRVSDGTLAGVVLDARDGEPFAGALVRAGDAEETSRDDGRFMLALEAGTYAVRVEAEGRRPSDPATVVVHRGETTEVTLEVPDAPAELRVRVPVGVVPAGYGKLVTIEADAQDPEGDPLTYTWRQLAGASVEASFQGQGTPTLTFRTQPLEEQVPLTGRFGPVAIPRAGQGEYTIEVEVSDGTHVATGRTLVRSGTAQGNWPRLAKGVDGYFDCGDIAHPDFIIDSVTPCLGPPYDDDCTSPELEGADTCTPRLRGYFTGAFFLLERSTQQRVLYEVGRWYGVNDRVSGCNRRDCHAQEADGWAVTRHASVFRRGIEGALREGYEPACARCHTMGDDVTGRNHGFDDVSVETGWDWPETLAPGNWDAMPPELQGTANVQCSACHGPAQFWAGLSVGVCAQCHDAPPTYTKVAEWRVSPMSRFVRGLEADDPALDPACTRCHSAQGFIAGIRAERRGTLDVDEPAPQRPWLRDVAKVDPPTAEVAEPVTCAACHDAHSENPYMLRVFGESAIPSHRDPLVAGSSAVCLRCHNAQVDPRDPADLAARRAPFFGAQADVLYGAGAMELEPASSAGIPHAGPLGCVGCHLRAPTDPSLAGVVGGHTFLVRSADGRPNVAACADCHDAADGFDVPAGGDWDGDGEVEPGRAEVRGLLALARTALGEAIVAAAIPDCLGAAVGAGVGEEGGRIVLVDAEGRILRGCGGEGLVVPDEHLELHRAAFDVMLVERDGSEGLHAPRYVAATLQAAVEALLADGRPDWEPAL